MNLYVPAPYPPTTTRAEMFQRFDPYGYRLWPSRVTTYFFPNKSGRQLTLASNKYGFRERDFDEHDTRRRVIVLGDSMVFGQGVEEEERFTEILETQESGWRVDNLGMTGFGPDLMLRALEEVGLGMKPDVVVFCMYTDDFRRVQPQTAGIGFPIPRFVLRSGQLATVPYPEPQFWQRLHLGVLLYQVYWKFSSVEYDLNAAILDRFLKHSRDHNFVPALLFLPGTSDNRTSRRHRAWLGDYAGRTGTPFLDLTEPIQGSKEPVFIQGDFHYNPQGHHTVASNLRDFMNRHVLRYK